MYLASYKELFVWQKSVTLVVKVFALSSKFPKSETYGLTSQMRRAAVAIPSNIAEGYGRKSPKEFRQFLSIAYGSALELETQLIIAKRLKFAPQEDFGILEEILLEVLKMLNSITSKLRLKSLDAKR